MKVYKLTHKITKKERYLEANTKREVKKCAGFQEEIKLITKEKEFSKLYCN